MFTKVIAAATIVATASAIKGETWESNTDCSGDATNTNTYKSNECICAQQPGKSDCLEVLGKKSYIKMSCDGKELTTTSYTTTDCSDDGTKTTSKDGIDKCYAAKGAKGSSKIDCSAGSMVTPTVAAFAAVASIFFALM